MIIDIFSAGPFETNSIIIGCASTRQCVVIDVPPESSSTLLKKMESLNLVPAMILITHSHWDHIGDSHICSSSR
jgi:hydroxyacylglutathione hydrolase